MYDLITINAANLSLLYFRYKCVSTNLRFYANMLLIEIYYFVIILMKGDGENCFSLAFTATDILNGYTLFPATTTSNFVSLSLEIAFRSEG